MARKIAVVENEFGRENIDSELLVSETNEQIIQMSNGCICCTIQKTCAPRCSCWLPRSARPSQISSAW